MGINDFIYTHTYIISHRRREKIGNMVRMIMMVFYIEENEFE